MGGLAAVLAKFPAGHVYAPVTQNDTQCFQDFVKYTQEQGLSVEVPAVGTSWQLGSATVQVLGPVAQYDDANDTSLVLRIDYGDTSVLLTGDMEQKAEDDLVASGANLDVDVLQVGHHGSETSTGYVFLNAVLPEVGVISVGEGNSYGHPSEDTLSRLRDAGVDVWRTDLAGNVTVTSDGTNYTVFSEFYVTPEEQNPTMTDGSGQQSRGGVAQNQVHLLGHKGVDDGGAQAGLTGYLGVDGNLFASGFHFLGESVHKALGCLVQGVMLHQLADADGIAVAAAAAGQAEAQAQAQNQRQKNSNSFFHFFFLQTIFS